MELYKNNTVSVIIPIYNAERFIAKALDSVLQQSYKDIEIILVDDCSSDRTEEVVNGYVEQYPQIIYQRLNKNQGSAVARNTALGLAKGRFVAFLDCDDVWCEGKLEFQLTFMNKIGAAISCTAMDVMSEDGEILGKVRNVQWKISYDFLLRNTIIATSTVIVDRNQIGNFKMPLRRGGQDYATWLMLMRNGINCYGLNKVLTHYRILSNSLSSNKWKSIKQVWQIQTHDEGIGKVPAIINVCCFIIHAFIKHFM